MRQYGAFYRVPFYRAGGVLSAFGVYSDVDSGTVAGDFDVSGRGTFLGLGYRQLLKPRGRFRHSLELSLQDRHFDNDTFFIAAAGGRTNNLGADTRSRPLALGYGGSWKLSKGNAGFDLAYVHNIPGGHENNDESYNFARLGARANWWALRLNASLDYLLPKNWLGRLRVRGQYSDQVLIPGEQFGIGGERSVRGFNERVVSGDRGLSGGLELWTPKLPYDLRLLGFLDAGVVQNADPLPGEIPSVTLASAGLGLRWYWNNQVSVEADLGYILQGIREPDDLDAAPGDTKLHFGIVYRY